MRVAIGAPGRLVQNYNDHQRNGVHQIIVLPCLTSYPEVFRIRQ